VTARGVFLGLVLLAGCSGPIRTVRFYNQGFMLPNRLAGRPRVLVNAVPERRLAMFPGSSESAFERSSILSDIRDRVEEELGLTMFDREGLASTPVILEILELTERPKAVASIRLVFLRGEEPLAAFEGRFEGARDVVTYETALFRAVDAAKQRVADNFDALRAAIEHGKPYAGTGAQAAAALPPPPAGGPALNIAIVDFQGDGLSATDAAVITNLFRGELVKTNRFNVVEKRNMDKILSEQAFQQSGCTTQECAVKLGKILNVNRMIVGNCGLLLGTYFVSVRVVSVETGKATYADEAKGRTVEDIEAGLKSISAKMALQSL
jgi:curli production assembly/transport component CsgG